MIFCLRTYVCVRMGSTVVFACFQVLRFGMSAIIYLWTQSMGSNRTPRVVSFCNAHTTFDSDLRVCFGHFTERFEAKQFFYHVDIENSGQLSRSSSCHRKYSNYWLYYCTDCNFSFVRLKSVSCLLHLLYVKNRKFKTYLVNIFTSLTVSIVYNNMSSDFCSYFVRYLFAPSSRTSERDGK